MNIENGNQEVIYCEDDGEDKVYCITCGKIRIERFFKNHLKSSTHFTNIRRDNNYIIQIQKPKIVYFL